MNPRIKSVNVLEDHMLALEFENRQKGVLSMKPYLDFPVFQDLKNYELFKQAKVIFGFVSWNDDIDMSPDTLYLDAKMVA